MSAVYDPSVIQQLADNLYQRADNVVALYSVVGFLAVGPAAFVATSDYIFAPGVALAVGLGGVIVGRLLAYPRALAMRAQAQALLCQAQIERNTRAAAAAYATTTSQAA